MGNDTTELSLASLELDKLEAVVELMFFAAYADGTIDPSERAVFEKNAVTATHGQLRPEVIRAARVASCPLGVYHQRVRSPCAVGMPAAST